jgi:hypothetical protein
MILGPVRRSCNKLYEEFDDLSDAVSNNVDTVQQILETPSPTGHPEQPVMAGPQIQPNVLHTETDAGSIATMGLVIGILGFEGIRWAQHKIDEMRGR